MAKKLYTGFESYWANKTADFTSTNAQIENLFTPVLIKNGSVANFDGTARTLTTKGAFDRGSYIRNDYAVNGSAPCMEIPNNLLSDGLAMSYFFRTSDFGSIAERQMISCRNAGTSKFIICGLDNTSIPNRISIRDSNGATVYANLPAPLVVNTWYNARIRIKDNEAYFEVNGISVTKVTTILWSELSNVNSVTNFNGFSNTSVNDFDDVCLNDLSGAVDNDLPPSARFFNATAQATAGAAAGWSVVPSGPTPQAALIDGTDANTLKAFAPGAVVGEVLPDSGSLYPSAVRVLAVNFSLKNVQRDSLSAPALSTRVNYSGGNVDTAVGPALVQTNQFVPTYYKTGTTEFTLADYDSAQAQLITT